MILREEKCMQLQQTPLQYSIKNGARRAQLYGTLILLKNLSDGCKGVERELEY